MFFCETTAVFCAFLVCPLFLALCRIASPLFGLVPPASPCHHFFASRRAWGTGLFDVFHQEWTARRSSICLAEEREVSYTYGRYLIGVEGHRGAGGVREGIGERSGFSRDQYADGYCRACTLLYAGFSLIRIAKKKGEGLALLSCCCERKEERVPHPAVKHNVW